LTSDLPTYHGGRRLVFGPSWSLVLTSVCSSPSSVLHPISVPCPFVVADTKEVFRFPTKN
jgi:hypothetical protein